MVIRPAEGTSALSTDGGLGWMTEIREGDVLLACGLLCSMYARNPSVCIEYPEAERRVCSRYMPLAGVRGVENFAHILQACLLNDR